MEKIKVLFVCIHNSARSQMAEAFLNELGQGKFEAESAGLEAGVLNPTVVTAMQEIGIDISKKETTSVFDLFKSGKHYNYVITVCDTINGEKCPIFPAITKKLHWGFTDPSSFKGDDKLAQTRIIRDEIKEQIEEFIKCQQN